MDRQESGRYLASFKDSRGAERPLGSYPHVAGMWASAVFWGLWGQDPWACLQLTWDLG